MAEIPNNTPLSIWFDTILHTLLTAPSTYTPTDFDPDQPLWMQIRVRGLVDAWLARQDTQPAWRTVLQAVEDAVPDDGGMETLLDAIEAVAAHLYAAGFADGQLWERTTNR